MDTNVLLNAVTAVIVVASPLLTSLFTHTVMSSRTKNTIAMIVSLVIAVVYEVVTGGIHDWSNLAFAFPIVYGLQQAVYNTILKDLATTVEAKVGVVSKGSVAAPETPVADVPAPEAPVALEETPAKG
jgi:ABC-type bacteriocin/lantibiotic exporter with double-glycine peptidase domain